MSSPFGSKTPESYFAGLRRKDSKNALTTCRGVTDRGRACRRALASPKNSSKYDGAVVLTENAEDPAIYFCWQHKDQAETVSQAEEGSVVSLKGRNSLEDAFRSLGLDDVDEENEPSPTPSPQTQIPEPSYTVANPQPRPSAAGYPYEKRQRKEHESPRYAATQEKPKRRRSGPRPDPPKSPFSLFSCCFGSEPRRDDRGRSRRDDRHPASKPIDLSAGRPQRPQHSPRYQQNSPKTPVEVRRKEIPSHRKSDSGISMREEKDRKNGNYIQDVYTSGGARLQVPTQSRSRFQVYRDASPTPAPRQAYQRHGDPRSDTMLHVPLSDRPLKARSKSSPDTQQLQRLHGDWPPPLPSNATDATRIAYAKLLTAMSEQPSKTDTPGYIYIFWQTDEEKTEDETSAVATIMSAPKLDRGLQRQETILQRRFFQTSANAPVPQVEKRTIFLKIGRAVNVHSRLNQWKKQCEYDITLLRSYPYSSRGEVKMVPNVVKVERLIHLHLEMLGQRVSKQCRCGTEHKEWFEVEATSGKVREVDEIVRRWVRWSEDKFMA